MKISKLIDVLSNALDLYGDIDVTITGSFAEMSKPNEPILDSPFFTTVEDFRFFDIGETAWDNGDTPHLFIDWRK